MKTTYGINFFQYVKSLLVKSISNIVIFNKEEALFETNLSWISPAFTIQLFSGKTRKLHYRWFSSVVRFFLQPTFLKYCSITQIMWLSSVYWNILCPKLDIFTDSGITYTLVWNAINLVLERIKCRALLGENWKNSGHTIQLWTKWSYSHGGKFTFGNWVLKATIL